MYKYVNTLIKSLMKLRAFKQLKLVKQMLLVIIDTVSVYWLLLMVNRPIPFSKYSRKRLHYTTDTPVLINR